MRRFLMVLGVATLVLALPVAAAADGLPTNNPCWSWQLPLPQGDDTPGMDFVDENEGWEVGDSGLILHTTDGGVTWERQTSGVEWDLWAVALATTGDGWAAGSGGILHTADGGVTWKPQYAEGAVGDLCFTSPLEGWAIAGGETEWSFESPVLLHTVDGGDSWGEVVIPVLRADRDYFDALAFADEDHGIIVGGHMKLWPGGGYSQGGPLALSTSDGGDTWTRTALPASASWDFGDVAASSATTWWASGDDVWRSDDGGATWRELDLGGDRASFGMIRFADELHGWAYRWGPTPKVLRTSDGGTTWVKSAIPDMYGWAMDFVSPMTGWVTGGNGWTARTTDGGASWTMLSTVAPRPRWFSYFDDVAFADDVHGVVVGWEGQILQTADGGQTWTPRDSGTGADLEMAAFPAAARAWAASRGDVVLRSDDGGVSWKRIHPELRVPPTQRASCRGVRFWTLAAPDAGHAILAGQTPDKRAVVLCTRDGGATWRCRVLGDERDPICGYSTDADNAWVFVTAEGRRKDPSELWRTTDGGATWSRVKTVRGYVGAVCFTDALNGWCSSFLRGLLHTSDGGVTWSRSAAVPGWYVWIYELFFVDPNEGWYLYAVEDGPQVLMHTRDGGAHWSEMDVGIGPNIDAGAFRASGQGWIVGGDGSIIHTTNGGGTAPVTAHDLPPAVRGYRAYAHDVTVTLSAWDAGTGVASTEFKVVRYDPRTYESTVVSSWTIGTQVQVAAPADHSGDDLYGISYRSTDLTGVREAAKYVAVIIDTLGPVCANARPAECARGQRVVLRCSVKDATSRECDMTVTIRRPDGGIVKRLVSRRYTGPLRIAFRCRLAPGKYRWTVTAADLAGNAQTQTTRSTLTVR